MRELTFKLTLLEDVIVNQRPTNQGGHKSLDYVPGTLLLGAVAARLYAKLSRSEAWQVFHSGQVQFGDALPLVDEHPCWPLPLCWHEKKQESAVVSGSINEARVQNFQHGTFADDAQPKQLRDGYIRADGRKVNIQKSLRMKTALDPTTGRADDRRLFGYESINAGQSFVARIRASDEVSAELWEQVGAVLAEHGELLLGRSRSAEYGRAEFWPVELALEPAIAPAQSEQVTLWCLSDVALLDKNGQPSLEPTPAALGLARGEINWKRSFLRFRRYAIWNAHRNGYDLERQVIQHGSVITLQLDSPLTDAERTQLAAGIGLYREAGLGWVSVDPALLATAQPVFASAIPAASVKSEPSEPQDAPLIAWLKAERGEDKVLREAEKRTRAAGTNLKKCYELARAYAGVPAHLPIGPSKAQWGSVYEKARAEDSANFDWLKRDLFEGANPVCKPAGEGWQDAFRDDAGVRNFCAWFSDAIDTLKTVQTVRLFAREAMRVADRERDHKTSANLEN